MSVGPSIAETRELTYPEIDLVYRELSRIKDSFGLNPDRRDRATVMIGACILHRFDYRSLIVKALRSKGLSPNLVGAILDENTGDVAGCTCGDATPPAATTFSMWPELIPVPRAGSGWCAGS